MNTHTVTYLALAMTVGVLACACDGDVGPTPTAPAVRPTYTLSGIISGETGMGQGPVDGARVRLATQETRSDTNGHYSISDLSAGHYSLSITKDGFETDARNVSITGNLTLDVAIARLPSHTLSGVVSELTAAGEVPLEGVEVYWSEYKGTFTNAQGFYTIEGIYAGVQPLWVAKDGYTFALNIPHRMGQPWRDVTISGDTRFDVQLVRR